MTREGSGHQNTSELFCETENWKLFCSYDLSSVVNILVDFAAVLITQAAMKKLLIYF